MKKLITSALPYVNNVPHLGNIVGSVLSADVYARYCRLRGYETLFVCGTDEYGTATEMKARQEGREPQEICDHYYAIHKRVYDWFGIQFDVFGRTTHPQHKEIVQDIFKACDANHVFIEQTSEQYFDEVLQTFLADRYLVGTCPYCGFTDAHGDQCDQCGKLLSPDQLGSIKSSFSSATPVKRPVQHLYLNLPNFEAKLVQWLADGQIKGEWSANAIAITQAWLREGLQARSITRDLKWGVPVPRPGFENKVFYVWFDAPIGYLSITAAARKDWLTWWQGSQVEWCAFMGKDNVPFHSILFPAILMATGSDWALPHHIFATEYLNYENDKFSKSRGIGVFGTDAIDSGIPADYWRYMLISTRPEQQDSNFTWKDFQARIVGECAANLGNLVHRILSFVHSKLEGKVAVLGSLAPEDQAFFEANQQLIHRYVQHLEVSELKEGLFLVMTLARAANKHFQDHAPWKMIKAQETQKAAQVLALLLMALRDIAILLSPFLPETAQKIGHMLGYQQLYWGDLQKPLPEGQLLSEPVLLFPLFDEGFFEGLEQRFSGKKS